ncbi:hypothetical protein [Acetobacter cibinongensis]|uniref:hypothetical protein n=1 Tax=Acetobacter cibinongensis TaxID=146475 RepID=UPI000A38D303|nr:hypothetical protein [Acetobacter cibinongensis]
MVFKLFRINTILCTVGCAALALLSGCTNTGSESKAQPVNLEQFTTGADRFAVMSTVGQPEGKLQHENRQCDIYKLYTSGFGVGGKAAVAAAEMLTGVSTFGLSEALWAPVKAGMNPNLHTVLFCYTQNEQLVDIYDKNPTSLSQAEHRIVNAQLYAASTVTPAAAVPNGKVSLIPSQVSATVTKPAGVSEPVSATGAATSKPATTTTTSTPTPTAPSLKTTADELNSLGHQALQAVGKAAIDKMTAVPSVPVTQPEVLDAVNPAAQ